MANVLRRATSVEILMVADFTGWTSQPVVGQVTWREELDDVGDWRWVIQCRRLRRDVRQGVGRHGCHRGCLQRQVNPCRYGPGLHPYAYPHAIRDVRWTDRHDAVPDLPVHRCDLHLGPNDLCQDVRHLQHLQDAPDAEADRDVDRHGNLLHAHHHPHHVRMRVRQSSLLGLAAEGSVF